MNRRRILIALILTLALIAGEATAVRLSIEIEPLVKGMTFFFDYSPVVDGEPQIFRTYWENRGSISCSNRMRVDIYNKSLKNISKTEEGYIDFIPEKNQNKLIYTAWSDEEIFHPGTNADIYAYFEPFNMTGNFSAQARVYSCNEIFYIEPFEFEIAKRVTDVPSGEIFESIDMQNINRTHIKIAIVPKEDLNSTLILAETPVSGWIIESQILGKMMGGETYEALIQYEPSVWMPRNVTFGFVVDDGRAYVRKGFEIKEVQKESGFNAGAAAITIISGMFVIVWITKRQKKMKKDIEKSSKDKKDKEGSCKFLK